MVHAFVDESKQRGLIVAAAITDPTAATRTRTAVNALRAKGQRRIHFTKESDPRKKMICARLCALEATVRVYDASAVANPRDARARALQHLVNDLASLNGRRLVIEQDDSLIRSDRHVLYRAVRAASVENTLTYEHVRPATEPLLWIADAAAWCWAKGPPWRTRIEPIIDTVTIVT